MKKRILAILLIFAFVSASFMGVDAKGARSFGRSSSKSFSKSFSSSKSSSSRSSGLFSSSKAKSSTSKSSSKSFSLFGSSKSKSSNSRSVPGSKSYTDSSSKKANTSGFTAKAASKKKSYMQDTYKSQISSKSYKTYKQKLNSQQQKVYNDSMKKSYGSSSRKMNFEDAMRTRSSRINVFNNRPIFINVNRSMFGSSFSYGYAYVGPWDLWFLMRASDLFWYHHWNEISPYRSYFDQSQYQKLENRVSQLEKQGVQRDPNYMEEGVDPDLQLSEQYQEKNPDNVYYTDKYPTNSSRNTGAVVVVIIITSVALIIVIRKLSKPKPKKSRQSRIY
ncbi:hypothetical protein Cpap_1895 [Ruminiclostridium papyrosolvens DSM 2782]|uniref:Uncharacterized protein n=1 Tax=Ruminiclostridium papyrosolvens DSM 2782 TaxID=588581 RepID=F1TE72_9FIRM|nr:hypothetical protein [Ruminiclostridium papyrosolvens]EGD47312.1 hypothetical protein Cpap_1895 [Ruminiclostridium papyrosolvens DSM 2782]WES34659.1 hypothetical protein P0092_01380 [Ruminiclostridium papyrosolvens DSM 2782]